MFKSFLTGIVFFSASVSFFMTSLVAQTEAQIAVHSKPQTEEKTTSLEEATRSTLKTPPSFPWKSEHKVKFEKISESALLSGKKVFVKFSAAWCGPCAFWDKYFLDHEAELKEAFSHYEMFYVEDTQLQLNYYTDVTPFEVFDFPNFYIYDPAQSMWSPISFSEGGPNSVQLNSEKLLKSFTSNDTVTSLMSQFEGILQRRDDFKNDENNELLISLLKAMAVEKTPAEFSRFTARVHGLMKSMPEKFNLDPEYGMKESLNRVALISFSKGHADLEEYTKIDPELFSDFTNGSVFYGYVYDFQVKFSVNVKRNGLLTAIQQCENLATEANKNYSDIDYNGWGDIKVNRTLFCIQLSYYAGLKTKAEILAFLPTIPVPADPQYKVMKRLASLYAALGEFKSATDSMDEIKAKYLSVYKKPVMVQRIEKAYLDRAEAFKNGKELL